MSNESNARVYAERAEWHRRQGNYLNAKNFFELAIKEDNNYPWAHAHLGETLLGAAYKCGPSREDVYEDAIKSFGNAIELYESNIAKCGDGIKKQQLNRGRAWAEAHLGEVYRVKMNKYYPPKNRARLVMDECFDKAEETFLSAIEIYEGLRAEIIKEEQVDDIYKELVYGGLAWTHSHLGATYCNRRYGKKEKGGERKSVLQQGLDHLEKAIRLRGFTYPWAYAFKVVAHVEMNLLERAFIDLFVAVLQDRQILDTMEYVISEYYNPQPLELQEQFVVAVWLYMKALSYVEKPGESSAEQVLESKLFAAYYLNVLRWYADEVFESGTGERSWDQNKLDEEILQLHEKDEDIQYLQAGLKALGGKPRAGETLSSKYEDNSEALCILEDAMGRKDSQVAQKLRYWARRDMAFYHLHQTEEECDQSKELVEKFRRLVEGSEKLDEEPAMQPDESDLYGWSAGN